MKEGEILTSTEWFPGRGGAGSSIVRGGGTRGRRSLAAGTKTLVSRGEVCEGGDGLEVGARGRVFDMGVVGGRMGRGGKREIGMRRGVGERGGSVEEGGGRSQGWECRRSILRKVERVRCERSCPTSACLAARA